MALQGTKVLVLEDAACAYDGRTIIRCATIMLECRGYGVQGTGPTPSNVDYRPLLADTYVRM